MLNWFYNFCREPSPYHINFRKFRIRIYETKNHTKEKLPIKLPQTLLYIIK